MTSGGARRGQFRIESGKYVSDGLKFPTTRTTKDSIDVHVLHRFTIKSNKKGSITEGTFFLPRSGTVATVVVLARRCVVQADHRPTFLRHSF